MQNSLVADIPANPFNPGSPVDPNDFVGRIQELENFQHKLKQTCEGSLASMSVAGGYGIGKTSFLHKCKVIAENNNILTIYFSLNELPSIDKMSLSKALLERLKEKVYAEAILKKISDTVFQSLKKIRVKIAGTLEVSYLDPELTFPNLHSALSESWKFLKSSKKAVLFLIDEAGVLEKNKAELIMYLRAVLEQLQTERIPIMIILGGKFATNSSSGSGFSPIVRTFPPAILDNFSKTESDTFIKKKLTSKNISIPDDLLQKAYDVTEGHPFVLSAYMGSTYLKLSHGENKLTSAHFEAADIDFVKRVLPAFFSRFFDNVGKNSKKILSCIANEGGEIDISELTKILKKEHNEISPYLAKLVQDGAIIRKERGKYKLFHKLFGNYIKEHTNSSTFYNELEKHIKI